MSGPVTDPHAVAKVVLRWIALAREAGHLKPDQLPDFASVQHSALLRRLLGGKLWLPHPPPCAFGYPWYEAVEQDRLAIGPDTERGAPHFGAPLLPDQVIIHQSIYVIEGARSDGGYVIRDAGHDTPYRWLLWREPASAPGRPGSWHMAITAGRP